MLTTVVLSRTELRQLSEEVPVRMESGASGENGRIPDTPRRPVRVVLISDTHSSHRQLDLPAGDILIHCGE